MTVRLGRKQSKVVNSYSAGILSIFKEKAAKDKYGTKIGKKERSFIQSFYFRSLGISSTEQYESMQADSLVIRRVAFRLFPELSADVNSSYVIDIGEKSYSISRVFHNYSKNETEVSLSEVVI